MSLLPPSYTGVPSFTSHCGFPTVDGGSGIGERTGRVWWGSGVRPVTLRYGPSGRRGVFVVRRCVTGHSRGVCLGPFARGPTTPRVCASALSLARPRVTHDPLVTESDERSRPVCVRTVVCLPADGPGVWVLPVVRPRVGRAATVVSLTGTRGCLRNGPTPDGSVPVAPSTTAK